MAEKGEVRVFVDNERVRVSGWRLAPGTTTGYHRHEFDYVVVPMSDGALRLVAQDGSESFANLKGGEPYFRQAGVEHETFNGNDFEFSLIEVEIK
jgi:quercetin dioxygenase-like cupin family protein